MFETLQMAPPDAILGLTEAFKADPNPSKINLAVGVFKNAQGETPVLDCVKQAERLLVEEEPTKGYLGIDGLPEYGTNVREMLFGAESDVLTSNRAVTVQAPGGTGALRVAGDFIVSQFPNARIWCSKPTWANHPNIFQAAGLEVMQYDYLNADRTAVDLEAFEASLGEARPGDVICLHGCCHNPTGVDPSAEQWTQIAEVLRNKGLLPLVDIAYQGFGAGLREDVAGLHAVVSANQELLVCSSFSKNFSLYAERVGALTLVATDEHAAKAALSHAKARVRANYSNPPKHGANVVAKVLSTPELKAGWESELTEMRDRINSMRELFATSMREVAPNRDFSFITQQRGMFSFSGLTPMQVDQLRNEHSIYIVGSGRINVAGMTESNMSQLCEAIAAVL